MSAAIKVKKKRGRKRKFLPFHTPSTGSHQFQSLSPLKGNNGNKGKNDSTPKGRKGIKKIKDGRENSYHFTHPAQGSINSNPHINQKERTGTKGKRTPHRKEEKE